MASHFIWDEEKMKEHQYAEPHGKYYVYQLAEQMDLPNLDISEILNKANADKGIPLYITKNELLFLSM